MARIQPEMAPPSICGPSHLTPMATTSRRLPDLFSFAERGRPPGSEATRRVHRRPTDCEMQRIKLIRGVRGAANG